MLTRDVSSFYDAGVRPVAYADASWDNAEPLTSLEGTVVWDVAPATGNAFIYPALFFQFSDWKTGGYFGTQIYGSGRGVHFSVWDHEGEFESSVPMSSTCQRFGHEGNGTMCHLEYPWLEGRAYRFHMSIASSTAEGDVWQTTVTDVVTGESEVVGRILVRSNGQRAGFGPLAPWAEFFLEYFGGPPTCAGHDYARLTWTGPRGNDVLADRMKVLYNLCERSNVTSPQAGTVTLEGGEGSTRTTPSGTSLWP